MTLHAGSKGNPHGNSITHTDTTIKGAQLTDHQVLANMGVMQSSNTSIKKSAVPEHHRAASPLRGKKMRMPYARFLHMP